MKNEKITNRFKCCSTTFNCCFRCRWRYYKKCVACHGAKAEKVFNNKVPALTSLDAAAIEAALKGYKTGANKFGLGAMMKPIATPMSDEDAKAVAEYIQTLK